MCTFHPGNFTGWGSEGVKPEVGQDIALQRTSPAAIDSAYLISVCMCFMQMHYYSDNANLSYTN